MDLASIVTDLAAALKSIDALGPTEPNKSFRPGIGPLTEATLVSLFTEALKVAKPTEYAGAGPRGYPGSRNECDLVIPDKWAIEVKLARPFGDNGKPAERWSENLLYPYPGNTSSIGDCYKLLKSGFAERKAVVVIGYEHAPPKILLEPALRGFEVLVSEVARSRLSARVAAAVPGLIHPYHHLAHVVGWEVLGAQGPSA